MDAKLSLTTRCNARCATCPVWQHRGEDMPVDKFALLWDKLNRNPFIDRILLNNTGDLYNHPEHLAIIEHIDTAPRQKRVIMTTNAGEMDRIPKIDVLIISFNGGTKESYERTTGLSWDEVRDNIRMHYDAIRLIPVVEMHCLIWEGNKGTEDSLLDAWRDFPGRIRVSYKYDNQMDKDYTLPEYKRPDRVPCDYLGMFSILPNGKVVSCAHDFDAVTDFGNAFESEIVDLMEHPARVAKMREHKKGIFSGICETCNYNTPIGNRLVFLK